MSGATDKSLSSGWVLKLDEATSKRELVVKVEQASLGCYGPTCASLFGFKDAGETMGDRILYMM